MYLVEVQIGEDIKGLLVVQPVTKGKAETTEALCTLIRTYKDQADGYVSQS